MPAYCMRSLNLECVIRILYAATASCMRYPHIVCGHRILYAVHALCMRRPHIVCGGKKGMSNRIQNRIPYAEFQ